MTSPSIPSQPLPKPARRKQSGFQRFGIPLLLFVITMFSTTAVGMRYMHNFRLGHPPLASDQDILPYEWVIHHLGDLASGLPFSLTLVGILLVHEFGHYFACRAFNIKATLPYMLPAPSLSGTFGAVIRLRSVIRTRAALIVIGASGPIAGFIVAIGTVTLGIALSNFSTTPLIHKVQPPLAILLLNMLMRHLPGAASHAAGLSLIIPHPVLIASWLGLLITALNLVPAGQLDGGHILYAVSPTAHKWSSRIVIASLLALGFFYWAGWLLWGIVLMTPAMRHPKVADTAPMTKGQYALVPICLVIFLLCGTFQPFQGYGLINILQKIPGHH